MCGRFAGYRKVEELIDNFPIDSVDAEIAANYNVAPSQAVLAIVRHEDENVLEKLHWGLVPFWAKDISIGNKLINARAETAAIKPSFKHAFKNRRCLIIADGFYEWQGSKGSKHPVYLSLPNDKPFAFAGLWETWIDKTQDGLTYTSCTILTTAASASVRPIHHRMPVILKPDKYDQWLDPTFQDLDKLNDILTNWIETDLKNRPVSKQVNAASNNHPSNIEPLTQIEINFPK